MEKLTAFVVEHVDKILDRLKANPATFYVKRTADAYAAAYALATALGENVHVDLVDWPPASGVCVGFPCEGLYIYERGMGVDGSEVQLEPMSISSLAYAVVKALTPLEPQVARALYVGHHAWTVDNCGYPCPQADQFAQQLGGRLGMAFPFQRRIPLQAAISLSTLPILPGVTGRGLQARGDAVALLDAALGAVAAEGFHTAVADKGIRYIPRDFDIAASAELLEASLAGHHAQDPLEAVKAHVAALSEAFHGLARGEQGRRELPISNPAYIYKLPPYLQFGRMADYLALRYEAVRGHVVAVVPPMQKRNHLDKAAEVLASVGQVLVMSTYLVVYVESGRYGDFRKAYEGLD